MSILFFIFFYFNIMYYCLLNLRSTRNHAQVAKGFLKLLLYVTFSVLKLQKSSLRLRLLFHSFGLGYSLYFSATIMRFESTTFPSATML